MEKLIRFYNQNKKTIFKYIGIILISYMILKIINTYYENRTFEEYNTNNTEVNVNTSENIVVDEEIKETKISKTVNTFIEYCKTSKSEEAYNMLTDETKKKNKYSTLEKFQMNFVDIFFETEKNYSVSKIEGYSNIYSIEIYNGDILSTGNANSINRKYIKEISKKITLLDYI